VALMGSGAEETRAGQQALHRLRRRGTAGDPFLAPSLRSAVIAANSDSGSTIVVPAGTYTLSIAGDDSTTGEDPTIGDLDVTGALTITGAGSGSTKIQAGNAAGTGIDKIFSFNPVDTGGVPFSAAGLAVSLSGLTLRFGKNPATFASFNGEGGAFDFDAGTANGGSLTLNDVIVDQNSTTDGDGGGIATFDGGVLNITNCQFSNNTSNTSGADLSGGGIFIGFSGTPGNYTITNTFVVGNKALNQNGATACQGGGVFNFDSGALTLHGVPVFNNQAGGVS